MASTDDVGENDVGAPPIGGMDEVPAETNDDKGADPDVSATDGSNAWGNAEGEDPTSAGLDLAVEGEGTSCSICADMSPWSLGSSHLTPCVLLQ